VAYLESNKQIIQLKLGFLLTSLAQHEEEPDHIVCGAQRPSGSKFVLKQLRILCRWFAGMEYDYILTVDFVSLSNHLNGTLTTLIYIACSF